MGLKGLVIWNAAVTARLYGQADDSTRCSVSGPWPSKNVERAKDCLAAERAEMHVSGPREAAFKEGTEHVHTAATSHHPATPRGGIQPLRGHDSGARNGLLSLRRHRSGARRTPIRAR
jgi:hypothetical protein